MATLLRFGPKDHGRIVTSEDLETADFKEGFRYEVIEGRLYVSPQADLPENRLESWIFIKLYEYKVTHAEVINWVTVRPRVFISSRRRLTVPEPDVGAYHDFPTDRDIEDVNWREVSPILTVEVLTGDPEKDLVRNVELYRRVPSIREYWVVDGRESQSRPDLRVYRRRGKGWLILDYPYDSIYTTRLLPGFELRVNPRG